MFRGYSEICQELLDKYPEPTQIVLDTDKKEFVQLFGDVLKLENILRNYDEFMEAGSFFPQGLMQDMRSVYVDIREEAYGGGRSGITETGIDFSDIEFEIELLKTDEISLDYIINLISKKSKDVASEEDLKEEIRRVIRSSMDMRSKEELVLSFISKSSPDVLTDDKTILEAFYTYARQEKEVAIKEMGLSHNLKEGYQEFIERSIANGNVSSLGIEINEILPPTSRRSGARERKKQEVLTALQKLAATYQGI